MKHFFSFLILLCTISVFAQNKATTEKIHFKCDVRNCASDSMILYEFNGMSYNKIESQRGVDRLITFELDKTEPRFYYVGFTVSDLKAVILGSESEVGMNINCASVKSSSITNSAINKQYDALKGQISAIRVQEGNIYSTYTSSQRTEQNTKEFTTKLAELDKRKLVLKDSITKVSPYLGSLIALNTYLSFQNNKGKYTDEVDYFANEYFKYAKLDDPNLEHNPWVSELFKGYTSALAGLKKGDTYVTDMIRKQLKKISEKSNTYRLALGGVVSGISQNSDVLFMEFGNEFAVRYAHTNVDDVNMMANRLQSIKNLMIGVQAPDFTLETPDGKQVSLSSYKGKYVLVDFWASWCRPCRAENPNVVAMYNHYKDKGFEVLGVSLDQNKDAWKKAIEDDKLTWQHVSDLKGWQSAPAAQYGITSIPHSVLIDRNGKIIARQLRGELLGAKLEEIFKSGSN